MSAEQDRDAARRRWLEAALAERAERLAGEPAPLLADASFRRFARVVTDAGPRVLVDAPPERENNAGFLAMGRWLEAVSLPASRILAADADRGFLLVSDLGDMTLERELRAHPERAETRLREAVDLLLDLQCAAQRDAAPLAAYDSDRLTLENGLFAQWFLGELLELNAPALLEDCIAELTRVHLAAPRVAVHLDWHGRNLMVTPAGLAMVDYQDARSGPQGYDLVSLLRDCYRRWPDALTEPLFAHFRTRAVQLGLPGVDDEQAFRRTADLVGIQRHLKAVGIFARLACRDGRDHALADIDRTLGHVVAVAARYATLQPLARWIDGVARPAWRARS